MGKIIQPEDLATGSEEGEQKALFCWCALNSEAYPELQWLFHIPNGGSRHIAEATKLKAMGVKSGVPDLCLPLPIIRHNNFTIAGLFIELKKVVKNKLVNPKSFWQSYTTDQQFIWIEHLNEHNYRAIVCHGWIEARNELVNYVKASRLRYPHG